MLYLDVQKFLCQNRGTFVDGNTGTIERPAKHFLGNSHLEGRTCELAMGVKVIDSGGSFEDLKRLKKEANEL